jgi:glycosyltransferase involved in cell wall biosynthesis
MVHDQKKETLAQLEQQAEPKAPQVTAKTSGVALPHLAENGHVMVAVAYYLLPSGMRVTMRNLLSNYHPSSYSIATIKDSRRHLEEDRIQVYPIMSTWRHYSSRLDNWWLDWQLSGATSRLIKLIEKTNTKVLVGVYPSFHFLKISRDAAKATQIPWIAYLHDTVAEGLASSRWAKQAVELQQQVFAEADSILVMSRGMADLYKRKYNLNCQPLEHTYPEPIPDHLPQTPALRQAFWGGDIYNINHQAVRRVSEALQQLDCPFLLTTAKPETLEPQGIVGDHVKTTFYRERADYLEALRQQGVLVLALNWPDESNLHEEELATIFPTKTPEYLVTGRPIIVHCPEHYFLARFFRENQCGLVVTERSVEALTKAIGRLLEDPAAVSNLRQSALRAAQIFSAEQIAGRFQAVVQAVAQA